jgi:glycosyltransferase involved in cell wall biosynthesis
LLHIAVIVPTWDEEANVERFLRGLVDQEYPPERRSILLIHDRSSEAAAAIGKSIASRHGQILGENFLISMLVFLRDSSTP